MNDAIIKKITRTCEETGTSFDVTEQMSKIYTSLNVPIPTIAPDIRLRHLRAHMGGIELFMRSSMNSQPLVSMYDPESPAQILSLAQWHADEFDTMRYGVKIDSTQSFFMQWKTFSKKVPRPAIIIDPQSENCSWSLYDLSFKDCYATFGGVACENILYGDMCIESNYSVDVSDIVESQWLYECVHCVKCSEAAFSEDCFGCINIFFCSGLVNCSDCFGCVNLQNKKYCIYNVQYSKEEYKKIISTIDLGDRTKVEEAANIAKDFWKKGFKEVEVHVRSENSIGEDVVDSTDTIGISTFKTERVYNAYDVAFIKDSCDVTTCSNLERSVNCVGCTNGYENKMSLLCDDCIDIEYSELCTSCEHCFGCIGLKRKKYCIFNIQYTKEEYFKLVEQIKATMLSLGEYGKFFPYNTSLIAYNISHADPFFHLNKQDITNLHGRWFDTPKIDEEQAAKLLHVPNKLSEIDESSILNNSFLCVETKRPFRIVKPELAFHKKMNIALPNIHPALRRKKRYRQMHGLKFYTGVCEHCKNQVQTRISPEKNEKLLCSLCYKKVLVENKMNMTL